MACFTGRYGLYVEILYYKCINYTIQNSFLLWSRCLLVNQGTLHCSVYSVLNHLKKGKLSYNDFGGTNI